MGGPGERLGSPAAVPRPPPYMLTLMLRRDELVMPGADHMPSSFL